MILPPIIICICIGSPKTSQAERSAKRGTKNIKELVFALPSFPLAIKKIVVARACPKTPR